MDLAGMQHARPNFEALKALMKRKYAVWLEMGVRRCTIFRRIHPGFAERAPGQPDLPFQGHAGGDKSSSRTMSVPLLYFDGKVRWSGKRLPSDLTRSL